MLSYTIRSDKIKNGIFIPKYYDPAIAESLNLLSSTHDLYCLGELIDASVIEVSTGDEVGKMAYGTGEIPFVRTSDISNWEIKTIPKQGLSREIYDIYAAKQDVHAGDILLVKDGTYLIGTNCIVTELDTPMVFQSHILKIRIIDKANIDPLLFFLSINSPIVQQQIRNVQFTADIIDTIGRRYRELILPIPKGVNIKTDLCLKTHVALNERTTCKATIKQFPVLMEDLLRTGSTDSFQSFMSKPISEIKNDLIQDTTTLELGSTVYFNLNSSKLINNIFLPKYYDPTIAKELLELEKTCNLFSITELIELGKIDISTGDEIGKMAYGTGDIPFIRTSDFSNWEIKFDPKQGVSQEIYDQYATKEDIQPLDVLLVRDGTYLVGASCLITEEDSKMLYCGGLLKIRSLDHEFLNPYLLLGLLNSYIVKRQIRTKQFTRDVIDTLGKRFSEVILPIPKDKKVKNDVIDEIERIITSRTAAKVAIKKLAEEVCYHF